MVVTTLVYWLVTLWRAARALRPTLSEMYAGVRVIRVPTGSSTDALQAFYQISGTLGLSFWSGIPTLNSHMDVEVPADKYTAFMNAVQTLSVANSLNATAHIEIMHEDLAISIAIESGIVNRELRARETSAFSNDAWFDSYHLFDDHMSFLDDLASTYPNNANIVTSGTSVEGRTLTGIHIHGSRRNGSRPAIVFHGTVHAREWITTMVVEYLAYRLLSEYETSPEVAGFVDSLDFYIFPIVNPDGFVYTQRFDRLWRKNRQKPPRGSHCFGLDINRNWNVSWYQERGASIDPCASYYKGLHPADAPETQGLADFLDRLTTSSSGIKMFIDWHSYSQLIMTPYGFTCEDPDNEELQTIALGFAQAMRGTYGTDFRAGSFCKMLYQASGESADYAYSRKSIQYSFTVELRDRGQQGFILRPEQIRPSCEEAWAGVRYLLHSIRESPKDVPCARMRL